MKATGDVEPDSIIDGSDTVLGRLASEVASRALDGENIAIVNSQDIVVSGNKNKIVDKYKERRELRSESGPNRSRRPEGIAKESVRGMLPDGKRGRKAEKRIKFYVNIPSEYKGEELETLENDVRHGIKLGEISKELGIDIKW